MREAYLDTPQIRPECPYQRDFDSIRDHEAHEELRHTEEKGHCLYNRSKEVVLRPQVARGLLGAGMSTTYARSLRTDVRPLVNFGVLGLGYFTYIHCDSLNLRRRTSPTPLSD